MKRGIVRVPEWAKEAKKEGLRTFQLDELTYPLDLSVDGMEAHPCDDTDSRLKDAWILNDHHMFIPPSWIEPIEEEPSIDWSRGLKQNTPLRVSQNGGLRVVRHFRRYNKETKKADVWTNGLTSYSGMKSEEWDNAEFVEEANPEDWYLDSEKKGFKCYCGGKLSYKINDKEGLTPEARLYLKCEKCGNEEHQKK